MSLGKPLSAGETVAVAITATAGSIGAAGIPQVIFLNYDSLRKPPLIFSKVKLLERLGWYGNLGDGSPDSRSSK